MLDEKPGAESFCRGRLSSEEVRRREVLQMQSLILLKPLFECGSFLLWNGSTQSLLPLKVSRVKKFVGVKFYKFKSFPLLKTFDVKKSVG